jgi:putative sterol carrier protein
MVQYLGLEYWGKVKEIANADEEFRIKTKMFNASFTYGATDNEAIPQIYMKFDDGEVMEVRELAAEEKTDYTLAGSYEIWTKLNKGELDAQSALMTRQLPFKGNMSSIIRYSKAFLRLFELMQTIPVEY